MHEDHWPRKTVRRETRAPHPAAFAGLILGNVALSFGAWFVRLADVGPVASGFWRMTLAAPLLLAAALASGWRPAVLPRALWATIILGGICFAADLAAWHVGILSTTLANATLFGNCAILMFPVYGFVVARSLPTQTQGIALTLAAIGATLLMGRSYELDSRHLAGDLLCLLAGMLYTAYFIAMSRAQTVQLPPLPALALATTASLPALLALSALLGERIVPHDWTPLIGLALISQVTGQGLMIFALGQLPPLVMGLALLVQPVVAAMIGWIIYGERLGMPDLLGAALVAVALVLVRRAPPAAAALAPVPVAAR